MKIEPFGTLQMTRTHPAHVGRAELSDISGAPMAAIPSAARQAQEKKRASFSEYLMEAMQTMNNQQLDVTNLEKQLITNPNSVDIEDVTIAMAKARMSLNLAQTVIDSMISGWNDISTSK